MRPSHEKTQLWQPKRGLDVLISRPPRQAGIPIKPWIQGAGCLWQRTCNYKTSVLRWILCSKNQRESRLSAQFLSLHKNLTRRAAKQLRTTQPHAHCRPSQRLEPHAPCEPSPRLKPHACRKPRATRTPCAAARDANCARRKKNPVPASRYRIKRARYF